MPMTEEASNNVDTLVLTDADDDLMLSTVDNPHSPKTEYDMWRQWDSEHGYYTEEYIARLVYMEEDYDVDDEFMLNVITSKVIAEILENDTLDIYVLV